MIKKSERVYIKVFGPWCTVFFTDPLAIPIARILASLRVHPNAITSVSLLAGLASGVFFAVGYWFWGAVVFQFSFLTDCLDGKVARLRQMTSEFGAKLDVWADSTRKPSSFIGIGIFFYLNDQHLMAYLTVMACIVHFATHKIYGMVGVSEYDLEFPEFHRRVVRRMAPRILALYTFFDEQFIQFVLFPLVAVIIGGREGKVWFLWGSLIITTLTFLKLVILWNHKREGRYEEVYQDWAGTKGNLDKSGLEIS